MSKTALIVGAGKGISAAFARALAGAGYKVMLAARNTGKLADLAAEISAEIVECDVTDPSAVTAMFEHADNSFGHLDVVLYNPSRRQSGPLVELDPDGVRETLMVTAYGGFLVAQAAVQRMLQHGSGAIFFTGASASIKGYPRSAPFAMGKFALRGLAQSMARELHPQNIHIAHFIIDGGVLSTTPERGQEVDNPDRWLDPKAIASTYLQILQQDRSAWSWEIELRPWVESF